MTRNFDFCPMAMDHDVRSVSKNQFKIPDFIIPVAKRKVMATPRLFILTGD